MTKLSRQAKLVRDHLRKAHLTSWQAEGVYRIRRLASRVNELKNAGFEIEKKRCEDATGQPYTRYSFSKAQRRSETPVNPPVESQRRYTLDEMTKLYADFCVSMDFIDEGDEAVEANSFRSYVEARA